MSTQVSISEFESFAVSNYPNIILQALADDFEPEMFSLIPSDRGEGPLHLEEAKKAILSHIKKTAKKRESLSYKYTLAIDSAEIILSKLKGGERNVLLEAETALGEIERLEKMVEAMPSKTRADLEDRSEVRKRIAKLSAEREILFGGILSPEGPSALTTLRKKARDSFEKTGSGADRLLSEAVGQLLGFRDKDIAGLEALVLKARQTRDVIEMAQWKLVDCIDAAIEGEWASKPGHAVPSLPFSETLLADRKTLKAFFDNGAGFGLALEGPIGTGKSSITRNIAAGAALEPATYAVPSLNSAFFGVPFHDKETGMVRVVPTEDGARLTTVPSCLVFDELLRVGNMGMDMQNMLLRLILDGEVSPGRKLHPLTMKIVTTNNPDDTSNPHSMRDWNEALANRMRHYCSTVSADMAKEWLAWARERFVTADDRSNASARVNDVLSYLSARLEERGTGVFHQMPKGRGMRDDPAFPTFRTWAAVLGSARNSSLGAADFARQVVASLVGKDAASDFLKFTTANAVLPSISDLVEMVQDFPYVYLSAAADSVVVQKDYFDEPEGGITDEKSKKTKKTEMPDGKRFTVKSLGRNTILQLNGGRHEPSGRELPPYSGKPLVDRMTDSVNRSHLERPESEICKTVEEYMNRTWGEIDGFSAGAAAESMLTGALSNHIRNSFESGAPADGKYISSILKAIALYPHPEARESMFRAIDRMLVSNPDKFILSGLRKYGVDYSTLEQNGNPETQGKMIKRLPYIAGDENAAENRVLAISKLLGLFPALATLEMASERWSRGCGRAATKYTAASRPKGQTAGRQGVPVQVGFSEETGEPEVLTGMFQEPM